MKQSKLLKSIFLALLLSALPLSASAYDFMVDDLAYNFNNDGTSVTVTSTVQSPWNGGNYNGLTTANIPSSVTYNGATYSVTSIGGETFLNCESLTSVTIPNSVTSIGGSAFYNCSGLTSVDIPNSVSSIGSHAFEACIGLTSVTIPNSVTSIGECAFCGCSGLTSVTIPNSVTSIGDETFACCRGLTSVTIPNSVTYIGSFAFDGCSSLTSITSLIEDPSSVGLGGGVFEGVNAQQCILFVPQGKVQDYRNADQWNAFRHITDASDLSGFITFADSEVERTCVQNWDVNGDGFLSYEEADLVTSISGFGYSSITSFNELEYFHNLTSIGDYAFKGCSSLTSITIPNSVTSIGEYAFRDCSGLTSVTIPNSVTSIGYGAFYNCGGLTSVTIPNSVTSIGEIAFYGCSGLTSITIPNSVTSIGEWVFSGCSSLTSIVVEEGNTTYDSRNNCNAIIETATNTLISGCKNTIIPNSVTSIGGGAFYGCSGLTSVTIGNSVTSIGESAFFDCLGLESIIIPNSVTSIGQAAFADNPQDDLTGSLTSITIPNSVISIGREAFRGENDLTITLTGHGSWNYSSNRHEGLSQIIGQIKTVNIGSGITSLGDFGFNPDVVNCYAEVPPTCSSNTFASYDGELHVPASSMADYFIADYWQNFTNLNNDITEKVTLNTTSATLIQHEELQLVATATPNNSAVIWSSTNQNVATVDNSGKVTATGQGECYIYATFATNPAVYASCHITASYPEITSLTLSETELVFNQIGETFTLAAITTPANSGPKPTWTSSDEAVATVDANGLVTAINLGECDITATVLNQSATCHVNVTSAIIITLDMASATIAPNEILTLTPSFNPVETDIVATSSDASVAFARVITQNGFKKVQILGVAEGIATITVASVDGKAIPATCVVTVASTVIPTDSSIITKALDNAGNPTFNWSKASAFVPVIVSESVYEAMNNDIILDMRPNDTNIHLWIWNETYVGCDDNGGMNSFGELEDHFALTVSNNQGWSGMGLIKDGNNNFSFIDDTYVLHLGIKGHPAQSHAFGLGSILFGVGTTPFYNYFDNGNLVKNIGTWPDDGEWYYVDLPIKELKKLGGELFSSTQGGATAYHDNFFWILSGGTQGNELHIDNVFLYKDSTIHPDPIIQGDANGDGTVNVSDYVYVANYILEQNPEPFFFAAADIDGNGEINVSDLVLVANIALTYEDPNTLNAPAPKATLNADIDMNAILHKNADGTTSITVDLNNSIDLTALQMDISLPQGMAVTGATLTDRATRSHQAEVAQLANGNYRLLAASSASKAFKGNEGALFTLTLSGEPQGTVTLDGIKLASPDGQCFTVNDMLLSPVVTGVDDITAQARIYGEAGNIVIESPVNGTAQLVLPNGMSRTVKVKTGRNIYPAPATGLVIVRAGEKAVKLIF